MAEKQEYVHQINGLPIAAGEAVSGSSLYQKIESKVDRADNPVSGDLAAFDDNGNLVDAHVNMNQFVTDVVMDSGSERRSLVNNHIAAFIETTDEEISDMINRLT